MNLDYIVSNGRKKERAERNAQRRAQTSNSDKKKLIEEKKAAIAEAMKRIKEKEK
jgi:electron transport complex protein RnfC